MTKLPMNMEVIVDTIFFLAYHFFHWLQRQLIYAKTKQDS